MLIKKTKILQYIYIKSRRHYKKMYYNELSFMMELIKSKLLPTVVYDLISQLIGVVFFFIL
ncbi:protein of unknown function [Clostridium beijerinckii]|nr:protein of unknown function [Clostridium beijerinckii]